MADEELEAKQVVSEEAEKPEKTKGSKKALIIFAGVVVMEALVLFFVFDFLRGGAHSASADSGHGEGGAEETYDFKGYLEKAREIPIGEVSIWDETDPSPRASRRYTASFSIWIEDEAFKEIEKVGEKNKDALNRVKSAIKQSIHEWMLQTGGETLKGLEMQHRCKEKLKDFLNDNLAPLKGKIVSVQMDNFKCARN